MRKLSAYVCVRNNFRLGYCVEAAIQSLLPVCDELVVCDSDSDDGTKDYLADVKATDARIRVINYPWRNPHGSATWWTEWLNYARAHLSHEMQLTLDADEVLDPMAHDEIKRAVSSGGSRWFHRLNFWKDPQHLVPDGHVCGIRVARLGPSRFHMPSDEPHPEGEPEIRLFAKDHAALRIFHYGFLRRRECFFAKSKVVHGAFTGGYDPRLQEAEDTGGNWQGKVLDVPLDAYDGPHPECARAWLAAQGHTL